MSVFMVTFGQYYRRHPHPSYLPVHPDGWATITADTINDARTAAFAHFGAEWAFLYPAADFDAALYPMGELARIDATPNGGRERALRRPVTSRAAHLGMIIGFSFLLFAGTYPWGTR